MEEIVFFVFLNILVVVEEVVFIVKIRLILGVVGGVEKK